MVQQIIKQEVAYKNLHLLFNLTFIGSLASTILAAAPENTPTMNNYSVNWKTQEKPDFFNLATLHLRGGGANVHD